MHRRDAFLPQSNFETRAIRTRLETIVGLTETEIQKRQMPSDCPLVQKLNWARCVCFHSYDNGANSRIGQTTNSADLLHV